jgi:predicted Rossmann fold flavoprotein
LIVVVGAGAAGLATAIFARRRGAAGAIVALDGARRLGAKILVSGGGRCNVTNRVVTEADFQGGSAAAVRRVLQGFPAEAAVGLFQEIGVPLREEEDGKLFPVSGKAKDVLDALLAEARRCQVEVRTAQRVVGIARAQAGYHVRTATGLLEAPRVVLATGGRSLPKTGSDGGGYALAGSLGHGLVAPCPALVPLVLEGEEPEGLRGVSVAVELTLSRPARRPLRVRGPMLFTHFGVSGPAVLDASRHWTRAEAEDVACAVTASFLPGLDFAAAEGWLLAAARRDPTRLLRSALQERLPASVAAFLLAGAGTPPDTRLGRLTRQARRALVGRLLALPLPVRASRGYNFAEVTAGGVPLEEVDPRTMESRRAGGLHLVGEMLDVDGRLGGFNFQWAWASAWAAGGSLARPL